MKAISLIQKFSIRKKLLISYTIFILLFIIVAVVSLTTMQRFEKGLNRFMINSDMIHTINVINGNVYKIISYSTTSFPKEKIDTLISEQKKSVADLRTLIENTTKEKHLSSGEREFYALILNDIKEYEKIIFDTFDIAVNDLSTASTYMLLAESNFEKLKSKLDKHLAGQVRDQTMAYRASIILLIVTTLTVIILSVLLSLLISSSITRPLFMVTSMAEQLAKSSGDLTKRIDVSSHDEIGDFSTQFNKFIENIQNLVGLTRKSTYKVFTAILSVTKGNNELAAQTSDQLAAVEEAAASLEEISTSVESIAQSAQEQAKFVSETYNSMNNLKQLVQEISSYAADALTSASDSNKEAEKGNELMKKAIMGMESIDKSTKQISEIVNLISDISEKVNLLALNAAIEAARAGEYGRGFAVVADEIGKLAEQTAISTKTIIQHVGSGLQGVLHGREYVDNTSKSLSVIIQNVRHTDMMVEKIVKSTQLQENFSNKILEDAQLIMNVSDTISAATGEQKSAMQEMVSFIQHINELTQKVASNAELIALSSKEIGAETETLNKHIESFKI